MMSFTYLEYIKPTHASDIGTDPKYHKSLVDLLISLSLSLTMSTPQELGTIGTTVEIVDQ